MRCLIFISLCYCYFDWYNAKSTKFQKRSEEFYHKVLNLLALGMGNKSLKKKHSSEDRGLYLLDIIGHFC